MTKLGVSDPDVVALQKRLKTDGIYSGPITGYFGPQTKAAVEAYQTKHNLNAIGVVGPGTRDLLNRGI
jgi:peptidoglycan hydrolase-like protein with peptidoglycan-binding domain